VVRHLVVYTVEVKLNRPFGTHVQDITRWARCFDFLAARAMHHPVHHERGPNPHINNVDPIGVMERQGGRATTLRRVCGISSIDGLAQRTKNMAQLYTEEAKQIRNFNPQHFLSLLRIPLSFFESMHSDQQYHDANRQGLVVSRHSGATRIGLASKKIMHQLFLPFKEKRDNWTQLCSDHANNLSYFIQIVHT
jgi:hypothetical protein